MKKCIVEKKWIRAVIYAFGIYVWSINIVVFVLFTFLLIYNAISIREYILSLLYILISGCPYILIHKYFLSQKAYRTKILKDKVIIDTYFHQYVFNKTDIVNQRISWYFFSKKNWAVVFRTNNEKTKTFYTQKRIL